MSVLSGDTNDEHCLTVETCISELAKLSLERKASSIAVRFSPREYFIQVVDNGIGFTKYELENIRVRDEKSLSSKNIFSRIRAASSTTVITSRSELSKKTYVVSFGNSSKLFEGYQRPSKGTTVSIHNFDPAQWNNDKNHSISYLVAAMAFMEVEVSFSVRNNDIGNLILNISKPHNSWEVIRSLKTNPTFITNLEIHTQKALQDKADGSDTQSELIRSSTLSTDVRLDSLPNIQMSHFVQDDTNRQSSTWSPWTIIDGNSITTDSNLDYSFESICTFSPIQQFSDENHVSLSQLSVWSDWSYNLESAKNQGRKNIRKKRDPRYQFLPISIYEKLPHKNLRILGNKKIIQSSQRSINILDEPKMVNCFDADSPKDRNLLNIKLKSSYLSSDQCRISASTIHSLQILGQVNREFIAAMSYENGRDLLIILDQHAAHERIRYEYLIESYRDVESCKYYSVQLDEELIISDIPEDLLRLIIFHKKAQSRVGLNIRVTLNSTTCGVDCVPKCFLKKIKSYNSEFNQHRLIKNVRELIIEIANGLAVSENFLPPILPITINNIIAGEACHEAIKFGDPLSNKECVSLVQALQDTKAPTRCAHGRPSIIPLLSLTMLKKRKSLKAHKKLNIQSLRDRIKAKDSNTSILKKCQLNNLIPDKLLPL